MCVSQTYNLLPPPESTKSRHLKPLKPPEDAKSVSNVEQPLQTASSVESKNSADDNWLAATELPKSEEKDTPPPTSEKEEETTGIEEVRNGEPIIKTPQSSKYVDAFTDLDPLGTGKSRPYVDKKYFFHELKNPPKKILKDLSDRDASFSVNFPSNMSDSRTDRLNDTPTFDQSISNIRKYSDGSNKDTQFSDPEHESVPAVATVSAANNSEIFKVDMNVHKTDDPIIGNNKALLVTDNDPFSPRMKKFDLFEDDFSKKSIDPFDLSFNKSGVKQRILPDTKIINESASKPDETTSVFNGPLQVSLPPESYSAYMNAKRMERQVSEVNETNSMVRNRPNVIKQNTVDVISSIGSKKMPHLFSQQFSKRYTNSINMRRLQESDSLSESEAAPEPPPRPDSNSHSEPPPLPPKKQFSDIVIRPRVTSPLATTRDYSKYDYLSASKLNQSIYSQPNNDSSPALPLPSRRVSRTESSYPGPGRPEKRNNKPEDDYLTPISSKNDELPILLPPPQTKGSFKNRGRRVESGQLQKLDEQVKPSESETSTHIALPSAIPDITLSQLLTLGVEDLALKLNVPVSKLNTMTIVELTKYLSDFIEKTSQKSAPFSSSEAPVGNNKITTQPQPLKTAAESAVFKVSFDDSNDATFVAKFDDNFAEDNDFVPNFEQFNQNTSSATIDRYAVFREIIDQEMQIEEKTDDKDLENEEPNTVEDTIPAPAIRKIDTKITAVISQAKDRYAALRDIILVEDLFQPANNTQANKQSASNTIEVFEDESDRFGEPEIQSSPDINISINLETHDLNNDASIARNVPNQPILSSTKDDLEIDEYMNRAISNLSLDNRDHLSPLSTKSPVTKSYNASTSPLQIQAVRDLTESASEHLQKAILNDVSTSPMSIRKSPIGKSPISKSPISEALLTPKSPKQVRTSVVLMDSPSKNAEESASVENKNGKKYFHYFFFWFCFL